MEDESIPTDGSNQTDELVTKLLAVKRHERPDEAYFDNFLSSFKDRQRSEMLSQSARGLLAERVSTWWWDGGSKWIYGASAVTAAAVAVGVMMNDDGSGNAPSEKSFSSGDFRIEGPAGTPVNTTSSRPAVLPAHPTNGYVPVSASSLQEL